jgi:hypothetical protein
MAYLMIFRSRTRRISRKQKLALPVKSLYRRSLEALVAKEGIIVDAVEEQFVIGAGKTRRNFPKMIRMNTKFVTNAISRFQTIKCLKH